MRVELSAYDPGWPREFEKHRVRLTAALGARATAIEHVGSTSVPGLAAKPIVDILVAGAAPEDRDVRTALEGAGYRLAVLEPGHEMYKPPGGGAHVHLWSDPSDARRLLLFRDWLRTHPEDCALYEHVKRKFAERHWETADHYAQAKTAVVQTILRRAAGEPAGLRIDAFAGLLERYVARPARILEIGAGEGLLAGRLAAMGYNVVALDTHLRSFFPVVETPFEEYEAPAGRFSCVAAQLVLHHAADLDAVLGKAARVLEAEGVIAIDDYGWERSSDPQFRADRADLHTSESMLAALRARFEELYYADHACVTDGAAGDFLGFTFIGRSRAQKVVEGG